MQSLRGWVWLISKKAVPSIKDFNCMDFFLLNQKGKR